MVSFLMVQGTSSNAGKSSVAAALCRIFSDRGYRVAPLKAQNMSSNLYITKNNREMAKAQAIQALASRTEPSEYMNPILLKPMGDYVSRVVLLGKVYKDMHAKDYYIKFALQKGVQYVKKAIDKLSKKYDIIVIEGAGGPAEINIAKYDIANMKLAEMLGAPVLIVADIERGGCFASIVGTMQLLKPEHRKLVRGFIINKFRGDKSILNPAIASVERFTKKSVLGVIPFVDSLLLPNEDSLGTDVGNAKPDKINIAMIKYPNAVNIADFESLLQSSDALNTYYVTSTSKLSEADLVLLPSSRDLTDDLEWMKENKIAERIGSLRAKKPVVGICEGFAMMCKNIRIDGEKTQGLGLIDTDVSQVRQVSGKVNFVVSSKKAIVCCNGKVLDGHLKGNYAVVYGPKVNRLLRVLQLNRKRREFDEGAISSDGLALGCSLYGLFDNALIRNKVIEYLSRKKNMRVKPSELDAFNFWDKEIQKFSDIVRDHVEIDRIMKLVEG